MPEDSSSPAEPSARADVTARAPVSGGALWRLPTRTLHSSRRGDSRRGPVAGDPFTHTLGVLRGGEVLLARFEIQRLVGRGGMSLVYAAFDRVRGEPVALKFLSPALLADPEAVERFQAEARLSIRLRHPHIVQVHEVHEHDGVWFLELELVATGTLRELLNRRRAAGEAFSLTEAVRLLTQVGDALAYAHQTTVHRDVKPENLAVLADGTFRLMDFGLARLLHGGDSQRLRPTLTQVRAGTPCYMAPETFREGVEPDHRADQYSLAVVLYELLAGELPLGLAAPLGERRSDLPLAFCAALSRALAADPARRFAGMAEMVAALTAAAKQRDGWRGFGRRHPRAARVAAGIAAVALLVPLAWFGQARVRERVDAWQVRLESAHRELQAREREVGVLALWARERERELLWLERQHASDLELWAAGRQQLAHRQTLLGRSNELAVARQLTSWLEPQLDRQRQPVELATLLADAREHWQAGRLDAFDARNAALAAAAAWQHTNWTSAKVGLERIRAARQIHAGWSALVTAGAAAPLPDDEAQWITGRLARAESLTGQAAAVAWAEVDRRLRPLVETPLQAARARFVAAQAAWAAEFPVTGPPDLRFIADPGGQAELAALLAGAGDFAGALRAFNDAAGPLEAWRSELRDLHERTEAAWQAIPETHRTVTDWGMRFRRVGEGRNEWWSMWETRVLDFAFFVQADGRGSRAAGEFWQQPGFPLSPTQPVVGVDWDTARRFAHWVGQRHAARHWHMGRLPNLGQREQLLRLLPPTEVPDLGIFPDRTEWNELHYLAQYRDPRLQAGDFLRPVALGRANALGLYDLQGNAWEWLADVQERAGDARNLGDATAWLLQGGGGFGEVSLHGYRPPSPETRFVGRKDAIGFRVVMAVE